MQTKRDARNVTLVTVGVFLQFLGFDTAQQFFAPWLSSQGKEDLALSGLILLYAVFFLSNFFAPQMVARMGLKRSLLLGSTPYALFGLSALSGAPALIYLACITVGLGAALFWNANTLLIDGSCIASEVGRKQGRKMSGLYWSNVVGALLATILLGRFGMSGIYLSLALVSVSALVVYANVEDRPSPAIQPVAGSVRSMLSPKPLLLLPVVFSGFYFLGQSAAAIPLLVQDKFGLASVGPTAVGMKLVAATSISLMGHAADRFGRGRVLATSLLAGILGTALICSGQVLPVVLLGVSVLAIQFSSTYPAVLAVIKDRFNPAENANAIGAFHLYSTAGAVSAYAATKLLARPQALMLGVVPLGLGLITLAIFMRRYPRLA